MMSTKETITTLLLRSRQQTIPFRGRHRVGPIFSEILRTSHYSTGGLNIEKP